MKASLSLHLKKVIFIKIEITIIKLKNYRKIQAFEDIIKSYQ